MSKKFRFYTLEELGTRSSERYYVNSEGISRNKDERSIPHNLLGTTINIYDEDLKEFKYSIAPWMGEEVLEKPEDRCWYDTDSDKLKIFVSGSEGYAVVNAQEGFLASLVQLKGIIQHLTDIKEYLETKEK